MTPPTTTREQAVGLAGHRATIEEKAPLPLPAAAVERGAVEPGAGCGAGGDGDRVSEWGGAVKRHLSLFSGIGGFDLAAHWAGFTTVAFCEKEPYCRRVLAKHWPGVPIFEDIHDVTADALRPFGPIDLITGGFPCQDISAAGKGAGIDGKRSGLWFEMLRVVRAVLPAWVVVENVPALRLRGADRVLEGLEEAGYAVWQVVVGSDDAGAPHLRKRVFIVAYPRRSASEPGAERGGRQARADTCRGGQGAAVADPRPQNEGSGGAHDGISVSTGEDLADACCPGSQVGPGTETERPHAAIGGSDSNGCEGRLAEPGLGRSPHGLSPRMDRPQWPARRGEEQYEWEPPRIAKGVPDRAARLKAIGNAVNPYQAHPILEWVAGQIQAVPTSTIKET